MIYANFRKDVEVLFTRRVKVKKISKALAVVLALVVVVLAGCGGGSVETTPATISVTPSTLVPPQNIGAGIANQVLGGYDVDIGGEAVSVQTHVLHLATGTASLGTSMITSISLYNESGTVIAGPVDATADGTVGQKAVFTDLVTYPVGRHTYVLKGKIPSSAVNGGAITVTTNPSSDWTNITGRMTGNTITITNGPVAMSPVTVRNATLSVTQSASPVAQSIITGSTGVTFANFQFDASQSGEDVRFASVGLTLATSTGLYTALSGCQLFEGATALSTGSNVVNPMLANAGVETFILDQAITIAKGTVKTLTLKCDVSPSATGMFTWSMTAAQIASITAVGATSGSSVVAVGVTTTGAAQAIGTGSLVVVTAPSSPSYAIAAAGSTGNTAVVARFRAVNETVNLARVGLKLTNKASSPASDLVQVSVWDGLVQVGVGYFVGTNTVATVTFTTAVVVPKDIDKDLTIKVDLSQIGTGYPGVQGDLIAIDVDTTGTSTQGVGATSGTVISATGGTNTSGIRLFKSFPTFAIGSVGSVGVADGKLIRFAVTANANGSIGINQLRFAIAMKSAAVANINLFAYTDSNYSTPVAGFTAGQVAAANTAAPFGIFTITPSAVISIPAGATYYFEARGTVTALMATYSVTTTLLGDAMYPSFTTNMGTSAAVAATTSNLVWSPNATTISSVTDVDWTNGYGVAGLPSSGLVQVRSN